jgi:tRNA pseudouridine38-40 synthase
MNYYKAIIQYNGSNYAGFQFQNGLKTIQNEINHSLRNLIPGKVTTVGASRTDTGVHALKQILKITCDEKIKEDDFVNSINHILPPDIKFISLNQCSSQYRPTAVAATKEYRYFFTNKKIPTPHEQQFIANISNELNIEEVNKCIQMLLGTHDFQNFYSMGSNVKSTIRNIVVCELEEINPHSVFISSELFLISKNIHQCYQFKIIADGFLKQMIRHLVSALWMVGSGKLTVQDFQNLLNEARIEKKPWKVAPPNGLFLFNINELI